MESLEIVLSCSLLNQAEGLHLSTVWLLLHGMLKGDAKTQNWQRTADEWLPAYCQTQSQLMLTRRHVFYFI